jgi:GNAT superfamily N-acetyltransferase
MLDTSESWGLRRALRRAARLLLGPYRFNRIYRSASTEIGPDVPHNTSFGRLEAVPPATTVSLELSDRFGYGGQDAHGYGLFLDGDLAAVCWFWGPQRFKDPLLWSLQKDEAVLVDLVTALHHRGRGLASALIRYASADMRRSGWSSLYTWMWHSHHASYHAFETAGWQHIAWVLEIHPFGMPRALRFCWRPPRRRAHGNSLDRIDHAPLKPSR